MTLTSVAAIAVGGAISSAIGALWDRYDAKRGRGPGLWEPASVTRIREWRARRSR